MTQVKEKQRGRKPQGAVRRVASDSLVYPNLKAAARACAMSVPTFSANVLPHIPHQRVGNRVLVSKVALQGWLEAQ